MIVSAMKRYYPTAILFEINQSKLNVVKEYPSYMLDKIRAGIDGGEIGVMYRFKFDFGNQAPESFEVVGRQNNYFNTNVNGIFDKRTGKLTLMLQPIKGKLGFKNDIDGGPVLWPKYISSNNELVTYIQPIEFMEYYAKIENPSAELTAIANKIKWDDNPIVIVAKLK